MPFCETYMTAFKNDVEYSQLVLHTTAVLQNHKFMQVSTRYALETSVSRTLKHLEGPHLCFQPLLTRKNELDKLRKEVKEQWQREQKKMVSWWTQWLQFGGATHASASESKVVLSAKGDRSKNALEIP